MFRSIMPGHGGQYNSETFTSASTTGADTIDCTTVRQLAIQVASDESAAGTFDLLQSFEGGQGQFVLFAANIPVTDGTIARFTEVDGPFGTLKIDATNISAGSVVIKIVGFTS